MYSNNAKRGGIGKEEEKNKKERHRKQIIKL